MTEGLITRIGKWMDHKWQAKVTEGDLQGFAEVINQRIANVEMAISKIDVSDLKTRMEKMELYAGMTRKVDPTKPPVVKSAFQM